MTKKKVWAYLWAKGQKLKCTFDGEKEREHPVEVTKDLGEIPWCTMKLQTMHTEHDQNGCSIENAFSIIVYLEHEENSVANNK